MAGDTSSGSDQNSRTGDIRHRLALLRQDKQRLKTLLFIPAERGFIKSNNVAAGSAGDKRQQDFRIPFRAVAVTLNG